MALKNVDQGQTLTCFAWGQGRHADHLKSALWPDLPDHPRPITRASDLPEPRRTIPILVALWAGQTRFNDLRRSIGSISSTLLSRLKEMKDNGLVGRVADSATGTVDHIRTDVEVAQEPALNEMARWAQQRLEADFALCTAKGSVLMWKMRKLIDTTPMPGRRVVMQFHFNAPTECDTSSAQVYHDTPVEI